MTKEVLGRIEGDIDLIWGSKVIFISIPYVVSP